MNSKKWLHPEITSSLRQIWLANFPRIIPSNFFIGDRTRWSRAARRDNKNLWNMCLPWNTYVSATKPISSRFPLSLVRSRMIITLEKVFVYTWHVGVDLSSWGLYHGWHRNVLQIRSLIYHRVPDPSICLSVCLSACLSLVLCPRRTNNNESNEAKSRSDATWALSQSSGNICRL